MVDALFTGSGTLSRTVSALIPAAFTGSGTLGLGYTSRENLWTDPFNGSASGWFSTTGTGAGSETLTYVSQAGITGTAVQCARVGSAGSIFDVRPQTFLASTEYTLAFDIVTNFANVGVQAVAKPVSATSNTGQVLGANTVVVANGGTPGTVVRVVQTFTTASTAPVAPHIGFLIRQANGSGSSPPDGSWVRVGEVALFRTPAPTDTSAFAGSSAPGVDRIYSWVGAENASASRELLGSQVRVTTQAHLTGSGSLSVGMHTYLDANFTGSGALSATSEIGEAVLFTPPMEGVYSNLKDRLFARMPRALGISLLKEDGLYRQVKEPTAEEVDAADIAYLGGHEYIVSDDEAEALEAAGYVDNLGYAGYGAGFYGAGDYGLPQGIG